MKPAPDGSSDIPEKPISTAFGKITWTYLSHPDSKAKHRPDSLVGQFVASGNNQVVPLLAIEAQSKKNVVFLTVEGTGVQISSDEPGTGKFSLLGQSAMIEPTGSYSLRLPSGQTSCKLTLFPSGPSFNGRQAVNLTNGPGGIGPPI
jgi:hypothetical protein